MEMGPEDEDIAICRPISLLAGCLLNPCGRPCIVQPESVCVNRIYTLTLDGPSGNFCCLQTWFVSGGVIH